MPTRRNSELSHKIGDIGIPICENGYGIFLIKEFSLVHTVIAIHHINK